MTRTHVVTLAFAVSLVGSLGCKNPERDELLNWLDDYDEERLGVRALLCGCPALLGFDTDDQCEAAEPAYSASEKECIADVFEGTEDRGIDYYSCVTPLLREYGDCLVNFGGTCEPTWSMPCEDEYDAAVADSCPELSSSKAAAVAACVD
jgi:hypothetical protein